MKNSPIVSVIMPVYNTARYIEAAIDSVLTQTFEDFELLIVDDEGTDTSIELCRKYADPRIRIISQENRGLAGARNTGIRHARGDFIALLDSDDLWESEKLRRHVEHLKAHPLVGVSFAASKMIDDDGNLLRVVQQPKLEGVTAADIFLRNPVGNGSAPVVRRAALNDIAFENAVRPELDYFDETFRQSEDIECWVRIALTTTWRFEGIPGALTRYRINEGGLSANVIRQFETWTRMREKVLAIAPDFSKRWSRKAEAFQLRYLARRCVRMGDGPMAWSLIKDAMKASPSIAWREPAKTITTLIAALALRTLPSLANRPLQAAIRGT